VDIRLLVPCTREGANKKEVFVWKASWKETTTANIGAILGIYYIRVIIYKLD
jgi:hypothetical protein